jgi:hypothetical protein
MSALKTVLGSALLFFWCCSAQADDMLLEGAIYCDSAEALSEVMSLAQAGDNQGLVKMIASGRILPKMLENKPVKVLTRGEDPDSPLEFRFLDSPATYWTLTRWVGPEPKSAAPLSSATPVPSPSPTPTPSAAPEGAERERKGAKREENAVRPPFDDQDGQIIWHQVDGKWKWRPRDPAHFKGVVPRIPE